MPLLSAVAFYEIIEPVTHCTLGVSVLISPAGAYFNVQFRKWKVRWTLIQLLSPRRWTFLDSNRWVMGLLLGLWISPAGAESKRWFFGVDCVLSRSARTLV